MVINQFRVSKITPTEVSRGVDLGGGAAFSSYRVLDAARRPVEVHVHAAGPEVAGRELQLQDLRGRGPEDVAGLLACVSVIAGLWVQ